jgi:hypothetical protein
MASNKAGTIVTYGAIIIAIISLILFFGKNCKKEVVDTTNLVTALQDSVKYYKDKDSVNKAIIQIISTESVSNFTGLQVKDREIVKLQEEVKKYQDKLKAGSSVTTGLVETIIKQKTPTVIVESKVDSTDTIGVAQITPIYISQDSTQWIQYKIVAAVDTTTFDLKVNNEFTAAVFYDSKLKKPYAEVTLLNPYSKVKSLRTYQVAIPKEKIKRWGIGISGGGTYIGKWRPYIGAGLNYNFIRF